MGRGLGILAANVAALAAVCLCVAAACVAGYGAVVAPAAAPPDPPGEHDFIGDWCSPRGDVLTLRADRFAVAHLSPAFDSQLVYSGPTFEPGKSYRWDEPPATSAAGSWHVSVLGSDLLADRQISIEIEVERLDDQAVSADGLEFDVHERHGGWAFSLPLKRHGSGALAFTRCEIGR